MRRLSGCALVVAMLVAVSAGVAAAAEPAATVERLVAEVLAEEPLIDGHNDAPWAIRERTGGRLRGFDFRDTSGLEEPMHTDLTRLRRGGVGGQFWSVWVPTDLAGPAAVKATFEQVDLVHRLVAAYPDDLGLARTAADVRRLHAEGRIASLIGVEGGHSLDGSLGVLRQLAAAGARYLTLTHWNTLDWADAATDVARSDGLSPFGETVVRELNRLGMLVDLSHVSAAAMNDALDVTRAPVIFSHSNAFALNPHPRNVPDDVLRRLAQNDGVVMVNFGAVFVSPEIVERHARHEGEEARLKALLFGDEAAIARGLAAWLAENRQPRVTIADLADHVDHLRDVAGIDHVGLGSDFDGVGTLPEGLADVSGYPALLGELARRGYSRDDLVKIAGRNTLRVMEAAERVAAELAAEPPAEPPAETDAN